MKRIVILIGLFFLLGCSSRIVPMDAGTYMIGRRSAQLGFGAPVGLKATIYKKANKFCAKENKQVETIDLQVVNSNFGRPGSVSLTFRCNEERIEK